MKSSANILILILILILWMCASSYWYVCGIKGFCQELVNTSLSNNNIAVEIPNIKITENDSTESNKEDKEEIPDNETTLKMENKVVYFEFAKDELKIDNELKNYMSNLKLFLDQNKNRKIDLIGHTDDVGEEENNKLLGLKRAEYVKKILIEAGIEGEIQTISKGENDPIAPNQTKEGRNIERRVEIIIN